MVRWNDPTVYCRGFRFDSAIQILLTVLEFGVWRNVSAVPIKMRPTATAKKVDIDYSQLAVDLSHLIDHLFTDEDSTADDHDSKLFLDSVTHPTPLQKHTTEMRNLTVPIVTIADTSESSHFIHSIHSGIPKILTPNTDFTVHALVNPSLKKKLHILHSIATKCGPVLFRRQHSI